MEIRVGLGVLDTQERVNGGKAVGEDLVSYEDEKRSIQLAVKATRNVGRSQSGTSSILRVLTLLATIESAGLLAPWAWLTCHRDAQHFTGLQYCNCSIPFGSH